MFLHTYWKHWKQSRWIVIGAWHPCMQTTLGIWRLRNHGLEYLTPPRGMKFKRKFKRHPGGAKFCWCLRDLIDVYVKKFEWKFKWKCWRHPGVEIVWGKKNYTDGDLSALSEQVCQCFTTWRARPSVYRTKWKPWTWRKYRWQQHKCHFAAGFPTRFGP